MTIIEALKADLIDRITVKDRWLYWQNKDEGSIALFGKQNKWIVRESKHGKRGSSIIIQTDDEEKAVEALLKQ